MGEAAQQLDLVLGRYRAIRPLGSGGSGSVWLARDERTGLDVALKMVAREGKAAARAEREAEAASQLRHERCQRAYAFERDSGHVYIAYEYIPGRTLRQAMRAGELPDAAAIEASAQCLDALAHAHARGIVHRDVKPANVMLVDGDEVAVKLLDFGLAHMAHLEALTATGDVPGTLAYISPERLRGDQGGPAADVWAVGVVLWEALAGRHPFWASSLADTARMIGDGAPPLATERPDLPRHVLEAVDGALAVAPEARPSAVELADALRRPLRGAGRPKRGAGAGVHQPRHRHQRLIPSVPSGLRLPPFAGRAAAAGAAGVAAGWVVATLPFFPAGWALGIAAAVALACAVRPRLGAVLALGVPVLPLGNLAAGAATAYAAVAVALLVALRFAPPRARRALVPAALVVAGFVASGVDARIAGSDDALGVARAVAAALPAAAYAGAALAAAVALLLPLARERGRWAIAALGALVTAAAAAPALPLLPLLGAAWLLCIPLWLEAEH
jgi:hypothetical protein